MKDEFDKMLVLPPWWRSGLFWRTFFLLAFLISVSMGVWVLSFRMVERAPLARQVANQIVSVVTITRIALAHSAPDLRRELLLELASNEGIRIYSVEPTDEIEPVPQDSFMPVLLHILQARLDPDTKVSRRVNGVDGFWISFKIDDEDEYWLLMSRGRIDAVANWQWMWWAGAGFGLSLLGAGFISGLVTRPLARLAFAARTFAAGRTPSPLPARGSSEVRDANYSFNEMVSEIKRHELERTEVLAGISHDLRTPLTRIQLELEMSDLTDEEKSGMESDIRQMDAIVGQFLDFARLRSQGYIETVNISSLLENAVIEAERVQNVLVDSRVDPDILVRGNHTDFERMVNNLISNAERYGRSDDSGNVELGIVCMKKNDDVLIEISDRGPGIPEEDKERLLRPFTRLDNARGEAGGSGLGLAIVNRIVARYGGKLFLKDGEAGGLTVSITFPLLPKSQ